jgi:hypothetical protein
MLALILFVALLLMCAMLQAWLCGIVCGNTARVGFNQHGRKAVCARL